MYQEVLNDKGKIIFPYLEKFKDFYLAGGTALALQMGHRISIDFDFFCDKKISKTLLNKVRKVFENKTVIPLVNNTDELTVLVEDVKITFLKYPFPVLHQLIDCDGLNLLSIKEIASTKAYSIGRRGVLKDYVDLYFIISKKEATLEEIIKISEKKYGDIFNARLFLEQLIDVKNVEDTDIVFLKEKVNKKTLELFFEKEIGKLKLS